MKCVSLSVLASLTFAITTGALHAAPLVEDDTFISATIGGQPFRLEALIVKPEGAQGRLPIALITHGRSSKPEDNSNTRARGMQAQARDMAQRGYLAVALVRRGFGKSEGLLAPGIDCERQDYITSLEHSADDLVAALESIASRPDADRSRSIAIGVSAGGATMLALAARKPRGLAGIVNVSGGVKLTARNGGPCRFEPSLIATAAFYGAQIRIPSLWLYAENDSFFEKDMVRRMHASFTGAGGRGDLQIYGPLKEDGHRLFNLFEGRRQWIASLDRFLRANRLPTWDMAGFEQALGAERVVRNDRAIVERYFALPGDKVLARSISGKKLYWFAGGELAQMRQKAVENCEKEAGEPCPILFENFDLMDQKTSDAKAAVDGDSVSR